MNDRKRNGPPPGPPDQGQDSHLLEKMGVQRPSAPARNLAPAEESRATQEIQAAVVAAISNPRDEFRAFDRMQSQFSVFNLADVSIYSYPRGGEIVSDLTIRAAALLQFGLWLWCAA